MNIDGAETLEVTKCPECYAKEPKIAVKLDINASGRVYNHFTCCNYIWVLDLKNVGLIIANIPVKKNSKKSSDPGSDLTN